MGGMMELKPQISQRFYDRAVTKTPRVAHLVAHVTASSSRVYHVLPPSFPLLSIIHALNQHRFSVMMCFDRTR